MSQYHARPGPRGLAAALPKLTRAAFRRRGFAQADVLTRWPAIVGDTLAGHCCPEKLSFPAGGTAGATLQVRVAAAFAPHLQHLAPLVIERINAYFGYAAVTRLRLIQGPLPPARKPPARRLRALSAAEETALAGRLAAVGDEALRAALAALGRSILERGADGPPDG